MSLRDVSDRDFIACLAHDAYLAYMDLCDRLGSRLPSSGGVVGDGRLLRGALDGCSARGCSRDVKSIVYNGSRRVLCPCRDFVVDTGLRDQSCSRELGCEDKRTSNEGTGTGVSVPLCDVLSGGDVRGPNWERNRAWREERRRKKMEKKKLFDEDQKKNKKKKKPGGVVKDGYFPGFESADWRKKSYFSDCSSITKEQLRNTRAEMLIARNKRDAARAAADAKRFEAGTKEGLVNELVRVTKLTNALRNTTKGSAIGGWAATVADSLTKSVAESACSSVPSLSSVGFGKSALRSSDGSGDQFVDAVRIAEYEEKKKELVEYYDSLEGYSLTEKEESFLSLDDEYSDLTISYEKRLLLNHEKKMITKLTGVVSTNVLKDVFSEHDFHF